MPTPGLISKENLKQILVFVPAVVYNIFVVLFSCQVNYITQKRICPAFELQILLCRVGAFFHAPVFCIYRLLNHRGMQDTITKTGCSEMSAACFCILQRALRQGYLVQCENMKAVYRSSRKKLLPLPAGAPAPAFFLRPERIRVIRVIT